ADVRLVAFRTRERRAPVEAAVRQVRQVVFTRQLSASQFFFEPAQTRIPQVARRIVVEALERAGFASAAVGGETLEAHAVVRRELVGQIQQAGEGTGRGTGLVGVG